MSSGLDSGLVSLLVQVFDHVVFKRVEIDQAKEDRQDDEETLAQTTNVSNPVKNRIDITIYSVQV